jgi:hypothetical protein
VAFLTALGGKFPEQVMPHPTPAPNDTLLQLEARWLLGGQVTEDLRALHAPMREKSTTLLC